MNQIVSFHGRELFPSLELEEKIRSSFFEVAHEYPEALPHIVIGKMALMPIPSFLHDSFGQVERMNIYDPLPQSHPAKTGLLPFTHLFKGKNHVSGRQQKLGSLASMLAEAPAFDEYVAITPALAADSLALPSDTVKKMLDEAPEFVIDEQGLTTFKFVRSVRKK